MEKLGLLLLNVEHVGFDLHPLAMLQPWANALHGQGRYEIRLIMLAGVICSVLRSSTSPVLFA